MLNSHGIIYLAGVYLFGQEYQTYVFVLRKENFVMGFIETIKERAKQNKKTIVLPETSDRRTLEAAKDSGRRNC